MEKLIITTTEEKISSLFCEGKFQSITELPHTKKFLENAAPKELKVIKREDSEIYIAEVFSRNYVAESANYIEALLKDLTTDEDDVILLLHDKDIYRFDTVDCVAKIDDLSVSLSQSPKLYAEISNKIVIVFTHQNNFCIIYTYILSNIAEIDLNEAKKYINLIKNIKIPEYLEDFDRSTEEMIAEVYSRVFGPSPDDNILAICKHLFY